MKTAQYSNTFFPNEGSEEPLKDLDDKVNYAFWYFAKRVEDSEDSGSEMTAEDFRAAMDLIDELVSYIPEESLKIPYAKK
jgi:hypothetical protein|tara:strand:- start:258 stop:497 length:240 start_codon:yes stop_codon:yes gene_type:complete